MNIWKLSWAIVIAGALHTGQQAQALPPPAVTGVEISSIAPEARYYRDVRFAGSPHSSATQQDAITVAFDYLFVAYYDNSHRLCLARRPVSGGAWAVITFSEQVPPGGVAANEDGHDTANVAVSLNDGRIHLAYGHHADTLRYKITPTANSATVPDANFTTALFSSQRNYLQVGQTLPQVTYPIFVHRETDKKMLMFWRERYSGDGDTYCATYFDNGTWGGKRMVIDGANGGTYQDGTKRNPYHNDIVTFGNDIHLTWCWREHPSGGTRNHDLMFAKSSDNAMSWQNTFGADVGTTGAGSYKMNLSSAVKDWDIGFNVTTGENWRLINQNTSFVDSLGNTHVVLRHSHTDQDPSVDVPNRRYWHYKRIGTSWTRRMIADDNGHFTAKNRPKMFIDRTHDTIYVVANVDNALKIYAAQKITLVNGNGVNDWAVWNDITPSTGLNTYSSDFNGRLVDGGDTLYLLGQRVPGSGATFSPIELIKLTLDEDP